jgi:hypothetical protein
MIEDEDEDEMDANKDVTRWSILPLPRSKRSL